MTRRRKTGPTPIPTPPTPLRRLSQVERAELHRITVEHAMRLRPEDAPDLRELARVRCRARAFAERLEREGPTLKSRSGAVKRNPAIAALDALRAEDRRLVVRLGLQRPDASTAREMAVARGRERLAVKIHQTFAGVGGDLLAGHTQWAAARATSEAAALELCLEIAKASRQSL